MKYYYTIIEVTNNKNKIYYKIEISDIQTDRIVYRTIIKNNNDNRIDKLKQYLNQDDIDKIKNYIFKNFYDINSSNKLLKNNRNKRPNALIRLLFAPYSEFVVIRIILTFVLIPILIIRLGLVECKTIDFYGDILVYGVVIIYAIYEFLARKYFIKHYVNRVIDRGIALIYEEYDI